MASMLERSDVAESFAGLTPDEIVDAHICGVLTFRRDMRISDIRLYAGWLKSADGAANRKMIKKLMDGANRDLDRTIAEMISHGCYDLPADDSDEDDSEATV